MRFIAWDIETDTSGGFGLDPNNGGIVSIAAGAYEATDHGIVESDVFFDTAEPGHDVSELELLEAFDLWLLLQPKSAIVGWRSAFFDAPFCRLRAGLVGADIDLGLELDEGLVSGWPPLPGFDGGYHHTWHGHTGRDLMYTDFDADWCKRHGARRGLKTVSEYFGARPVKVDRARIHLLSAEELRDYNMSDVELTARLYAFALARPSRLAG